MTITPDDIAWLWVKMTQAFGYKFLSCFGEKDEGVWFCGLQDLTPSDLNNGFQKMLKTISEEERKKGEAWPPNVKEFRLYCERRLTDYGLPDIHRAFAEIENNQWLSCPIWSHPLVHLAELLLQRECEKDTDRIRLFDCFQWIYRELTERFMRGDIALIKQCEKLCQSQRQKRIQKQKRLQYTNKVTEFLNREGEISC